MRRFLGVLLPTSVICAGIVTFLLLLQLMEPKYMSYFYSHVAVLVHAELCGLCPLEIRLHAPFRFVEEWCCQGSGAYSAVTLP